MKTNLFLHVIRVEMERQAGALLQDRVKSYFRPKDPSSENNVLFICEVNKCEKEISGKKISNLTAHIKKHHKDFFQQNVGFLSSREYEPLPVKRLKFIQNCSEIIAVGGRPFTSLNDIGFLRITEEKRNDLIANGYGGGLHAPNYTAIKTHIAYLAGQILQQIKTDVQDKFVSVMVDGATKYNRSILGINIQYISDGRHILRCIGMINLTAGHTAAYLQTQIQNRLNVFEIKCNQIVAVTTDNAPNMLATVALMSEHYETLQRSDDVLETAANIDDSDDCDDGATANAANNFNLFDAIESIDLDDNNTDEAEEQNDRNELLEEILNDDDIYRATLDELKDRLKLTTLNVKGVRCGVHILQLAVKAALKALASPVIDACRTVCKTLRKQSSVYLLRKHGTTIKVPRLDVRTRWNSTSLMVRILLFNISFFRSSGGFDCCCLCFELRPVAFGFSLCSDANKIIFKIKFIVSLNSLNTRPKLKPPMHDVKIISDD